MKVERKDILKIIGNKIKEARKIANITQDAVAEKIGISPDQFRNIENGRNLGSIEVIINICNILNLTTDELFYEVLTNKTEIMDKKIYRKFEKLSLKGKVFIEAMTNHINKHGIM